MPQTVWNDADIPEMLLACGAIPCTIGGIPGIGLLDEAEHVYGQEGQGPVIDQVTGVTVQTSAFPSAAVDDVLTIDGRTGTVIERLKIGDGGLSRIVFGDT